MRYSTYSPASRDANGKRTGQPSIVKQGFGPNHVRGHVYGKQTSTIFIQRNGNKNIERISRIEGHALIQAGKAKPINRETVRKLKAN